MSRGELIKNFGRIREYMHEFYVYGFKTSRIEKSKKTYENEKYHIMTYLGEHMQYRQDKTRNNRVYFISFDSRDIYCNPLYRAWKSKSFTAPQATMYFSIMDILKEREMPITEILDEFSALDFLIATDECIGYDTANLKTKVREYTKGGILRVEQSGNTNKYSIIERKGIDNEDALRFFSEVAPCGVLGSYLLDDEDENGYIRFKHHYITGTMDSEVTYTVFDAITDKEKIVLKLYDNTIVTGVPVYFMESTYNGRQYVIIYNRKFSAYRIDYIETAYKLSEAKKDRDVKKSESVINETAITAEEFDEIRRTFDSERKYIWGVSTKREENQKPKHIEFTVRYTDKEKYIRTRIEREKRCGTVTDLERDDMYNYCRFTADLYDSIEIIPWIKTFTGRITEINMEDKTTEFQRFRNSVDKMAELYRIHDSAEGGENSDL